MKKRRQNDVVKIPKLEVAIVCHRFKRLALLKKCSQLFCFKRVKALKNFLDKLDTSKTEEAETKNSVCDLKNVQTDTNPEIVKQYNAC